MEIVLNNLGSLALAGIVVSVLKYQPERMNTHRLLSHITHFVPTESMLLSTDGMIISVNKHRFLCNGLTRSDMEQHTLEALFLSSSDIRQHMLLLSAGQEETSNLIVQARTPSKNSVDIRINLHPLKNAHLHVVYFLIMLYPIRNEQSVAHRIQQLYGLTTRETEVLDWLIQGERYLNIAEHLYISLNTVKSHAKSIYLKTSTANRNELQDLTNALEKNTNKTN